MNYINLISPPPSPCQTWEWFYNYKKKKKNQTFNFSFNWNSLMSGISIWLLFNFLIIKVILTKELDANPRYSCIFFFFLFEKLENFPASKSTFVWLTVGNQKILIDFVIIINYIINCFLINFCGKCFYL